MAKAILKAFFESSTCLFFSRYQAWTLNTKNVPARKAPIHTCSSRSTLEGLNTMAQKSVISARAIMPSPTMWYPAGVCCQELATTIHTAENMEPSHTPRVAMKCTRGLTRFQPKSSTPRNPLSKAKAKMPSAASALPNMSPTKREYVAQLVPNSNSMTMPVATPMPKVRANILVQKRAICSYTF